jgi:hypothetical protein
MCRLKYKHKRVYLALVRGDVYFIIDRTTGNTSLSSVSKMIMETALTFRM